MANLNSNELEALRILWEQGTLKPAEIQEHFSWPIENATLRSVLRLLVEKGHITRRKEGKAYFYQARTSQKGMLSSMAQLMAHVFSGGSPTGLIAELIRTEKLSKEELAELQRIADEKVSKSQKAK